MSDLRQRKSTGGDNKAQETPSKNKADSDKAGGVQPLHLGLWTFLALQNWILDFGRPIAMTWVPLEYSPLNLPSVGDYFHMAYNVITPFILLKLMERCPRKLPESLKFLAVVFFVQGASIHLVGDSVDHRLIHLGYQAHLSVRDNPIMKNLQPPELVNSFELLYFYDEELGHLMWYIPLFIAFALYFWGCFSKNQSASMPILAYPIILLSAAYNWYLSTEGQIIEVFLLTWVVFLLTWVVQSAKGNTLDVNGRFLLWTFTLSLMLVAVWVAYLWDDAEMRKRYPQVFYVPEPWTLYSVWRVRHGATI